MNKAVSIKVNARHIGQLGRELVTDYVTALTELVKNSYDADSEAVDVVFENILSRNGKIIIADTGNGFSMSDIENKWAVIGTNSKVKSPYSKKYKRRCAGRKGIGRYSVERLAEYCTIYSFSELEPPVKYFTNWNKYEGIDKNELKQRVAILKNHSDFESAKYIKRALEYLLLSECVDAESKSLIRSKVLLDNELDFNLFYEKDILERIEKYLYSIYEKYSSLEERVEEIQNVVEELEGDEREYYYKRLLELYQKAKISSKNEKEIYTGTFLVLEDLRDQWGKSDIEKVMKEFRLLVSPFKDNNNFSVFVTAPEFDLYEVKLENNILEQRYAEVKASLTSRLSENSKLVSVFKTSYVDIKGAHVEREEILNASLVGDLNITLYYFLRDKSLKFEGLSAAEAKAVLDSFCGVKIYRDGFRVRPYGEEGNDWLLLDRSKIKDPHGYRVGNNQVIGVIDINSDSNPLLIDATNREAIIENEAFGELKKIVKKCIGIIEQYRYNEYQEDRKNSRIEQEEIRRRDEQAIVKEKIKRTQDKVEAALKKGDFDGVKKSVLEMADTLILNQKQENRHYEKTKKEYERRIEDDNNELQLYKNLAALGILAGSFGHETDDSIARIIQNIVYPKKRLLEVFPNDEDIKDTFVELDDDINRISCYSNLLVSFLKKKKRSEESLISFKNVIEEIVRYYRILVEEYSVEIDISDLQEFVCEIPMKQIDIESIVVNLLTNAFEALKGESDVRKIKISTHYQGDYVVTVEDSGPGVEEGLIDWIFIPLNTTKQEDGVGLGLTIVKDIVKNYKGSISVGKSETLGGALFTVRIPARG